jgi:hypothetical protein
MVLRAILTVLLVAQPGLAWAIEELTNPISSYELTLMPPTKGAPVVFGWIRLLNGTKDAGYIYLEDKVVDPSLSFKKEYIVTQMPVASLETMLSILRSERNLQIRFFDPQSPGISPTVFIEPAATAVTLTEGFRLSKEAVEEMKARRK